MTSRTSTIGYHSHTYRSHSSGTFPLLKVLARFLGHAGHRMNLAHILISICTVLVLMYGVNLYSIISDTVALQDLNRQAQALTATIEDLDAQYLKLSSKITPDTLAAYGLEAGEVSYFISRTNSADRVAFRAQ